VHEVQAAFRLNPTGYTLRLPERVRRAVLQPLEPLNYRLSALSVSASHSLSLPVSVSHALTVSHSPSTPSLSHSVSVSEKEREKGREREPIDVDTGRAGEREKDSETENNERELATPRPSPSPSVPVSLSNGPAASTKTHPYVSESPLASFGIAMASSSSPSVSVSLPPSLSSSPAAPVTAAHGLPRVLDKAISAASKFAQASANVSYATVHRGTILSSGVKDKYRPPLPVPISGALSKKPPLSIAPSLSLSRSNSGSGLASLQGQGQGLQSPLTRSALPLSVTSSPAAAAGSVQNSPISPSREGVQNQDAGMEATPSRSSKRNKTSK
jgi:hypothetical protein